MRNIRTIQRVRFIFLLTGILLAGLAPGLAQSLFDKPLPHARTTYLNDFAGLLSADAAAALTRQLQAVREEHGIEMTVVTIDSVADYLDDPVIETFSTRLFNHWGVGNAQRNDGVMILVAARDRKMRIELGSGYEAHWDGRMEKVIQRAFIPRFKEDRFADGIEAGTRATIAELTRSGFGRFLHSLKGIFGVIVGSVALVILAPLSFVARHFWRRRPRRCTGCDRKMILLSEQREDLYLDDGQIHEEEIGSVNYDVWRCRACEHLEIFRYRRWLTRAATCEQCGYESLLTESTVTKKANEYREGARRLDHRCDHCGFADHEFEAIPMVTSSDSSWSSGGSSGGFGGGGSSGGGASGSW